MTSPSKNKYWLDPFFSVSFCYGPATNTSQFYYDTNSKRLWSGALRIPLPFTNNKLVIRGGFQQEMFPE